MENNHTKAFEECIPIAAVIDDCIIAYDGAITIGWEIFPQEEYTITEGQYDQMTGLLASAFRSLGEWTVVHRQDIYYKRQYHRGDEVSGGYLSECYARHFEGREYIAHSQFFWFTINPSKNGKGGVMKGSFSSTAGGRPYRSPVLKDFEQTLESFVSRCSRFIASVCSNGCLAARRVTSEDLEGVPGGDPGILEQYRCWFGPEHSGSDIIREKGTYLDRDSRRLFSYSFSETDDYPAEVSNFKRTDRGTEGKLELFLSSSSPIGGELPFNHIVNQYYIFPNQQYALRELDRRMKNMTSMSQGSQENTVHAQGIKEFIDLIHSDNSMAMFCHMNILAWGERNRTKWMDEAVGAALSNMGMAAKPNTVDTPQLFFAGFPGAACEVGEDNFMLCELTQAMCIGINESFSRDFPNGKFMLCDRHRLIPVKVDTQQAAYDANYIENYNAFVLGPSGSGKSFFTNWYVRNCYDQGQSVFIIDKGDSYEGLCRLINEESGGEDGVYYKWSKDKPFSFAPFEGCSSWDGEDDGEMNMSFVISLIKMMWQPENGWSGDSNSILFCLIKDFIKKHSGDDPLIFDDFLYFLREDILPRIEWAGIMEERKKEQLARNEKSEIVDEGRSYNVGGVPVTPKSFDLGSMIRALSTYALDGQYGFLLNAKHATGLIRSRFVIFEIDAISKGTNNLYEICTFCIIHTFERKMRSDSDTFRLMVIEEAWQAIASEATAEYIRELWKTARKYHTSAMVVTQQASDLKSSEIVQDAIINNSPVKFLLDQKGNSSSLDEIVEMLGLSVIEKELVVSVGTGLNDKYNYKEVFISLGGRKYGVFALEVSLEEALVYESEKTKKRPLMELADKLGSIIQAVKELVKIK